MTGLKSLFRTPETNLSRKYRQEIHSCERRLQEADSIDALGLVHAYQRSIELRKEYLCNSQINLKALSKVD